MLSCYRLQGGTYAIDSQPFSHENIYLTLKAANGIQKPAQRIIMKASKIQMMIDCFGALNFARDLLIST